MPWRFQASYLKYHYDEEANELSLYENHRAHKTRYIDCEANRYGSDSYDGLHFYQKRIDYSKNIMVTKRGDGECKVYRLSQNYDLKAYYASMYSPEAGRVKYVGLIVAPWDGSQHFHGFVEQAGAKKTTYYYSEVTGNLLWVKKEFGERKTVVYEYREGFQEKIEEDFFSLEC